MNTNPNDRIEVDGILAELPSEAPRCGDQSIAVAFKFKLVEGIKGQLEQDFLIGIIPCPDFKEDDFFQAGQAYSISATWGMDQSQNYEVINDYGEEPWKKSWVIEINRQQ